MIDARHPPAVSLPVATASGLTAPLIAGLAALLLYLTISANLLYTAGIAYDAAGGTLPEKLHPGTYVALLALGLTLARHGLPALRRDLAATGFLALMLLCIAYQAATGGSDRLVVYAESFVPAGALALVFAQADARARRILGWWLLGWLLLNVAIALAETIRHQQWIPVYLTDHELIARNEEFRPTALYDHPLTGAMLSMIGLFLAAATGGRWRAVLMLAFAVGVLAFGGRAALAASVAVLAAQAGRFVLRGLVAGRMRRRDGVLLLAALACAAGVPAVLLATTAVGARIAEHFYWDESAAARSVEWQVLGMLDTGEWLFGATRDRVDIFVANLGLRYPFVAIETFWLLLFLYLGLFGFPLFLTGLVLLVGGAFRRAGGPGRVLLVAVLAVASTSNSLGRKSNILTVLIPAVIATSGFARGRCHAG
jgi:hypothetical protein